MRCPDPSRGRNSGTPSAIAWADSEGVMRHWHLDYRSKPVAHDHKLRRDHDGHDSSYSSAGLRGMWRSKDGAVMWAAAEARQKAMDERTV